MFEGSHQCKKKNWEKIHKHFFCNYFSGGDEKRGLAQESRSQAKRSPDPQVKYNPWGKHFFYIIFLYYPWVCKHCAHILARTEICLSQFMHWIIDFQQFLLQVWQAKKSLRRNHHTATKVDWRSDLFHIKYKMQKSYVMIQT